MSHLPPELIEHILLFLPGPDEHWRLPSLARVSQAWSLPAQIRLYSHVKITKGVWPRLCQSLQHAPYLRELVRSLELCVDPWPKRRSPPSAFAHLFPELRSLAFGPAIPCNRMALDQLVEAAPGLRSLQVVASDVTWAEIQATLHAHSSWERLTISLKRRTRWSNNECECDLMQSLGET